MYSNIREAFIIGIIFSRRATVDQSINVLSMVWSSVRFLSP